MWAGIQKDRARGLRVAGSAARGHDALAHVVRVLRIPRCRIGGRRHRREARHRKHRHRIDPQRPGTGQSGRIERVQKDLKKKKETILELELALLLRCKEALEFEQPLREIDSSGREEDADRFYVLVAQADAVRPESGYDEAGEIGNVVAKYKLEKLGSKPQTAVVPFGGKIEAELADLSDAEAAK